VHLPTRKSYRDAEPDAWRKLLAAELPRRGIAYVDVSPALREVDAAAMPALFLKRGEVDYPGAVGHYSAQGNRWAARTILAELLELPDVAALLDGLE
jgi:hypothetical protein